MVLSTLQTIALIVGIAYYIIIMRNSQRTRELTLQSQELTRKAQEQAIETRQTQLFMNIYNQGFTNRQFVEDMKTVSRLQWEDYDEYRAIFDSTNPETRNNDLARTMIIAFYEGVGVLVRENLLDIRMVALLMTGPTKDFWEKLKPIAEEVRERTNYPRWCSETEYLYEELMKYISEHPEIKT
jgi:hypothetical protein